MVHPIDIHAKKREMNIHLALNRIKQLAKDREEKETTNTGKLMAKFAQFQVDQIKDMLDTELVTEEEIREILLDYREADEILNNI